MNFIEKAIDFCETHTCENCPRRNVPCISGNSIDGHDIIINCGNIKEIEPKQLVEMIYFYEYL
jgi:hypothetical protein